MVDTNNDNTTQPLTFAEHLDRLPHQPGDRLAISWEPPGRGMKTRVVDLADAQAEVDKHITTANVWYRVNPTTLPAGTIGRRGRNCETARQVAVYADLDVKPGGCEDIEQAEQIITAVKHIVGTWPVTIVYTGHGVQPYWALESEIEIPNNALSKAFGRLVAAVADKEFGVTVDTVSDLARMLRVPGSVNFKDSEGRQLVKAAADIGGPLTPEELIERMAEVGIELSDDDDDDVGEAISPPEDWIFYPDTDCAYVAKMVAGWATDVVPKRHTWFLSQSIRIEAAHRWGCLHDQAHKDAVKAVLENEFRRRLAGEPGRPKRLEISDIRREAVKRVAAKTNEQVHAELGWHDHNAKAAAPPKAGEAKPKLWDAGDLSPIRQARFLAKNRIPKAAVTILCGDEGIGKSLFWVYIAAAVTTGKPLPEFGIPPREPANNILVLTEDNWQEDVLPRLTVVKADLSRIKVICTDPDGTGSPIFPDSMELITNAEPRPPVVVIDAWLDTVPGNLSVKDTQQARAALAPWKDAATRTGAAIILLTHPNRLSTGNMRDKYGATMALRQKARMTLYALQDPKDGTLILGPDKANNAPGGTKASSFKIISEQYFDPTPDHDGTVPSLTYEGGTGKTVKQHLLEVVDAEQRKARRRTAAEEWLIEFLAGGPRKSVEVYAEGAKCEHEFSKPQLKRAKANVARAVRISDVGGDHGDGCWYWELKPEHAVSAAATEARLDDAEHRPRVRGNPFADLAANDDDDESD